MNPLRKIVIVGSGAIGCYYGARLARSGEEVHFLMRGDLATVRERGLSISLPGEKFHLAPSRFHAAATPAEIGPGDIVIVALKTTAGAALRGLITPLLRDDTAILTLQNGLGPDEELAAAFGPARVLGGLCFVCVNRLAPGEISCTSAGAVSFAEYQRPASARLRDIAGKFERAGIKAIVSDNLLELRWRKLIWNVPFNGLSIAAGGVTTDRILDDPALAGEAAALMREIAAAAAAHGIMIPDTFIRRQLDSTRAMGAYKPSSLVDYLAGREVEVESIWGEPLRRARARNVPVPRLEMLHALLRSATAPARGASTPAK